MPIMSKLPFRQQQCRLRVSVPAMTDVAGFAGSAIAGLPAAAAAAAVSAATVITYIGNDATTIVDQKRNTLTAAAAAAAAATQVAPAATANDVRRVANVATPTANQMCTPTS
jgi:malate/lactate dehydrogenase